MNLKSQPFAPKSAKNPNDWDSEKSPSKTQDDDPFFQNENQQDEKSEESVSLSANSITAKLLKLKSSRSSASEEPVHYYRH